MFTTALTKYPVGIWNKDGTPYTNRDGEVMYQWECCCAPEWVLDEMFPNDAMLTAQKAKALEWVARQPEPVSLQAVARAPGPARGSCGWKAVRALVEEGALVKCGLRYYVPLKVKVRGKTFYHEPRSVTEWKKKAGSRVTDIDNLWRRKTHK